VALPQFGQGNITKYCARREFIPHEAQVAASMMTGQGEWGCIFKVYPRRAPPPPNPPWSGREYPVLHAFGPL